MAIPIGYKLAAGSVVAIGIVMLWVVNAQAKSMPSSIDPEEPDQAPRPPPPIPGGPGTRPLTAFEKQTLSPFIPAVDLESATLHVGDMPFYADMAIDASAITRDTDIYFKDRSLTFTEPKSLATLAHELVHVGQYRNGMNWATYLASIVASGGYGRSNMYEGPAYAMGDKVLAYLQARMS